MNSHNVEKVAVYDFWNKVSCGEALYLREKDRTGYMEQARRRYELEPYIRDFADFSNAKGKRILEIGVGLGADHQEFAVAGADLFGLDLTERAVEHTRYRLSLFGLTSTLQVGDAEQLSLQDEYFDIVYAWGVLHHSPDTQQAINEVWRVLKRGGIAKIMIYHKYSLVGLMLWLRYALFRLRPLMSMAEVYANYLESPGTKAYSVREARVMFRQFNEVYIRTVLTHGDLLQAGSGQRHEGKLLTLARKIWPRNFIKRFFPNLGLFMPIEARK